MKTYAGSIRIVVEHNAVEDELIVRRFEQSLNVHAEEQALGRALSMVLASRSSFCAENGIPEASLGAISVVTPEVSPDPEHLS